MQAVTKLSEGSQKVMRPKFANHRNAAEQRGTKKDAHGSVPAKHSRSLVRLYDCPLEQAVKL